MTRIQPSKPRLMARVLDAVMSIGDNRGSSAHEVLSFIRQGNASLKNLTLQVRRALKHAVNAGLLRHRSGRYKILATLNPTPAPVSVAKESINNDQKNEKKTPRSDIQATSIDKTRSSRRARTKVNTSRRQIGKHSDNARKKTQRSSRIKRTSGSTLDRKPQKRAHEEEEFEDQSSGRYVLHGRDESSEPFNRKRKRPRVFKQESESSDYSDGSDRESDVDRKHVFRASTSSSSRRREPKRKEARARSRGRSTSRARSAQCVRQQPIEEVENDRHRCDENHGLAKRDSERQESSEDAEDRQPSGANDGNSLENS
ncbi:peptidyl-prolyl cis-trans isomerase G-like [Odontomachus brunneus]|uniref:peptidyl-prolyl cis-trans isomerase G-like n=1 Tax=Odontomachus brunneus TaxID=486640 RepID=UPI0013F21B76|nr:peptidyl-prolyl cis-trans isomerase G-like [Odontomachus brunneus]XP_032686057.1 peptidyl-prolyl cis-trans isomerase G-like [Odontomachus brunneus]